MKLIIASLVLLATTLQCQGSLSLLGGILSTAHERVHDVAGAVLGTINKGLNFNLDGQFGVNQERQPDYGYQHQMQQNEYDSYNHGQVYYGNIPNHNVVQQPPNNNRQPYVPNNNGYNRPQYNGNNNFNGQYGTEPSRYPNNNYQNNYQNYPNNNNFGYNDQPRPDNQNYGNGYSENQNQGHNYNQNQNYPHNQNYPNSNGYNNQNSEYDNQNNEYDIENNVYENQSNGYNDQNSVYNNQNNINKPNFEKPVNNGYGTTQGQKYPDQTSTSRPRLTPPTTTPNAPTTDVNDEKQDQSSSGNTTEDAPLFIPLGQDEYVYGGDKINITAPKREADNKPQTEEEEDLPIDIRFGNK